MSVLPTYLSKTPSLNSNDSHAPLVNSSAAAIQDPGYLIGSPDYQLAVTVDTTAAGKVLIPALAPNGKAIAYYELQVQDATALVYYTEIGVPPLTDGSCAVLPSNFVTYRPAVVSNMGILGIVTTGTALVNVKYWTV